MKALARPVKLSPTAMKGGAILLAGVVLLCFFAGFPYMWHAHIRAEADEQRAELDLLKARMLARTSTGGPVLTEADQVGEMFLPGSTAGTTLAAFQSLINDAARNSGMSVLRMQPLPTEDAEGLSPYRLGVDSSGSLQQLQAFLLAVETMLPIVIVTGFEVRPRSAEGPQSQPYASEDLAVSLRLEAYSWRGTP